MIHWLLTQMEENPNAVFCGKELAERFPGAFQETIQKRLLRQVQTPPDSGYYDSGLNTPHLVVADAAGLEAIDEDDPETDPIPLTREDLARYALDLEAFAKAVQQANQLAGKPSPLTDRLFFLGESEKEGVLAAYVLALVNDSPGVRGILEGVPSLLPRACRSILVACPSHVVAPTEKRRLEDLGIRVALLQSDNCLLLPSHDAVCQELSSTKSGFLLSDFSVRWRGQSFPLTQQEAAVIKMLYQAHRAGTPDLSWQHIQTRLSVLEMYPSRMRDVFRESPLRGTLVIRTGKNLYRLDL